MAINNLVAKFSRLSQARIDDHRKPHYGTQLEWTQTIRESKNDTRYYLLLGDTEYHRQQGSS